MKNKIISLIGVLLVTVFTTYGQGQMDALRYSQTDINGTARFTSMAGAFTALGGDMTTLHQNPAGIAVYRSADLSMTLGGFFSNTSTKTGSAGSTAGDQSRFLFNNVGYVISLPGSSNSSIVNWNIGLSYNKQKIFDRTSRVQYRGIRSSITNYVAAVTNGYNENLLAGSNYNSGANWMSVLGYNGYMISPRAVNSDGIQLYDGFYNPNLDSDINANMLIQESGSVGDYAISMGLNLDNTLYLGATLGISELNYSVNAFYEEDFYWQPDPQVQYNTAFGLSNGMIASGTGVNLKLGAIYRVTDNWRIGAAVHTPTAYYMSETFYGRVDYKNVALGNGHIVTGYTETPEGYTEYNLSTPWRVMFGTAFVIGQKGLISVDYEGGGYQYAKLSASDYYYDDPFQWDNDMSRNYNKWVSTLRVGAEFKVAPSLALRAGYAFQSSPLSQEIRNGNIEVFTAGTRPFYIAEGNTNYFSLGLGYRSGPFYLDIAGSLKNQQANVFPFAPINFSDGTKDSPEIGHMTANNYSILATFGVRF